MGKNLARFTKNGWYGMDAETFTTTAKREENEAMATIKEKKFRLEALETAYDAVKQAADGMLSKWDCVEVNGKSNWTERTLTIEELDEYEQTKHKAFTDFLKELDKLA